MHADTPTTQQTNKETIRRLFAAFAALDDRAMDALLAPDFLSHSVPPGCSNDAAGMKKAAVLLHTALHDCRNEIDDIVAEGDKVVVRYTTRATHGGDLFGVPASGRAVTLTGIEMYRLSNGKVAEMWAEYDMSELFEAAE